MVYDKLMLRLSQITPQELKITQEWRPLHGKSLSALGADKSRSSLSKCRM